MKEHRPAAATHPEPPPHDARDLHHYLIPTDQRPDPTSAPIQPAPDPTDGHRVPHADQHRAATNTAIAG
ncbi:hypothetical protein AAHZ94_00725 [Streptomyces sp. HSW2009]|uniref:hypothetical protein n=1 Tax=Streptomyces sp. HSW2009 TaxID=3142890 RepID=UPI0032F04C21